MERPKQYNIEALLNSAVQPFDPADQEWLDAVAKEVRKGGGMISPVSITSDGILVDGSQRLTAMLKAGRKVISAEDVHIIEAATAENALDYAIKLNVARRQLSVEQKAGLARRLQKERGWSQGRIAKAFGVSRPAVSQWLARVPDTDPDSGPTFVTGVNGKQYIRDEPPAHREDPDPVNPWHPSKGRAAKAVASARRTLKALEGEPPTGLTALQRASLEQMLQDTVELCEQVLSALEE